MNRRRFVIGGLTALGAPVAGEAQVAGKAVFGQRLRALRIPLRIADLHDKVRPTIQPRCCNLRPLNTPRLRRLL